MGRLKDDLAECADQIANEMHGCGFYELDEEMQDEVWHQSEEMFKDKYAVSQDYLKEIKKYGE